jgi:cell wall assembly regulator SMI1
MLKQIQELDALIQSKRPELYRSMEAGVPDVYMEAEFGPLYEGLPDDLKAIWNWHNGQGQEYSGEFHPRNKDRLMSVDDSTECIEVINDSTEVGILKGDNWQDDWVPFTEDISGNHLCVATQTGEVFYFDRNGDSTGQRYASIKNWLDDTVSEYKKL